MDDQIPKELRLDELSLSVSDGAPSVSVSMETRQPKAKAKTATPGERPLSVTQGQQPPRRTQRPPVGPAKQESNRLWSAGICQCSFSNWRSCTCIACTCL
eukprot:TRINITY_DN16656_c0_g1_i14.p2 TRINITY_DN16656_c0_g1~~TRINITY_DN16656_c0_g1_i14.p2  ORF type:complete len:100 (-),score=18.20 TRINITY_DN16656_c0_g1_i14:682-981(-)